MEAPQKDAGPVCSRILLVEDDPEHVFIALTVLRQLLGDDTQILVAESAEEALTIIDKFTDTDRPDLILVDLYLPGEGGFRVLSGLRSHGLPSEVPIFVVTSSMYDRDVALSYELGACAVLFKPLSRAQLRDELRRMAVLP
jgi:CheY-like chemotaxis protein